MTPAFYIMDIIYDGSTEMKVVIASYQGMMIVNKSKLDEISEKYGVKSCDDIRENPDKEESLS